MQIALPANFEPRRYQLPLMKYFDGGGKRAVVCWARRMGKDRTLLSVASKLAFQRVGLYWHCLPTLRQAKRAVWDNITSDGQQLMRSTFPDEIVRKRNEVEMKVELVNGSVIQLVGADNYDALVGANPVHVTFSEFALTHPKAWDLVRPILRENGGSAAFISTPRGYNDFHRLLEYARQDNAWFHEVLDVVGSGVMTDADVAAEIKAGMPEELARQEFYCDFSAANVGSILGARIEQAQKDGRIHDDVLRDPHGPEPELILDIGYSDATAVWCIQRRPDGFAVLGYDEDTGLDAQEWITRFNRSNWSAESIGRVWLPHDARAKTFATGRSVQEQFKAAGYRVQITPSISKTDQINAARTVMRKCQFNRTACAEGLRMLRDWQFKYDEARRTFSDKPDHNYASHCGDAFAYAAVALQTSPPPEVRVDKPFAAPVDRSFTLSQLWDTGPTKSDRI